MNFLKIYKRIQTEMRRPTIEDILSPEVLQLAEPYKDSVVKGEFICSLIRERAAKLQPLNRDLFYEIGFAKTEYIENILAKDAPPGRTYLTYLLGLIRDFYREKRKGPLLGDPDYPGLVERKVLGNGLELLTYEIKINK
jgi:hypothetical protein